MESTAALAPLPRGIYRAPYLIDGCPVLLAVTSRGERLKRVVVLRAGVSESRATEWLETVLDRLDPPRPALRLVSAPEPRRITVEQLDALYRDASPVAAALYQRKRDRLKGNAH